MTIHARGSDDEPNGGGTPESVMTKEQVRRLIQHEFAGARPNRLGQKTKFIKIGPIEARGLQAHAMFGRQRELREANLRKLIIGIQTGRYLNNNPIWICHQKDIDEYVTINGQHTLEAFVQTDATYEMPAVLDPVADAAAVEERYGLFDMGAARTQADILRMVDLMINIAEEDDPEPIYATAQQIKKSSEAMTWLSSGLESNAEVADKYERADAIRSIWEPEVVKFWRTLGEKRDPELGGNEAAIWAAFYKNITGGAYQAPLLASFRAFPEETTRILADLVDIAKNGGMIQDEELEDPRWVSVYALYLVIISESGYKFYGRRRYLLVWRVSLYLNHARNQSEDAKRDERSKNRQRDYSHAEHSWELVTDDTVPKPRIELTPVDMTGARSRRVTRKGQQPGNGDGRHPPH